MPEQCPFCEPDADRVWLENDIGIAVWDAFPVTRGPHPGRAQATRCEYLRSLPPMTKPHCGDWSPRLAAAHDTLHPDGFNIGLNDGEAAGQTIMHAHIHIIPACR